MEYNSQLAFEMKFTPLETLAYQLCAYYIKLRKEKFPNYRHGRAVKDIANLKKSTMFKHMLKFIKENGKRFDTFQMLLFIRAQFEVMKIIADKGHQPLIEVNMIHGEKANKRWAVWKKWIAEKTNISPLTYTFVESNLIYDFEKTKSTIMNILKNDVTIENYYKNASNILRFAIIKEICPTYILLSNWVKQLPEQIKEDLNDICNIRLYKDFDTVKAYKLYEKYFDFEINK